MYVLNENTEERLAERNEAALECGVVSSLVAVPLRLWGWLIAMLFAAPSP